MEESLTIVAIATPPGRGGVAVVRLSGPEAFQIGRALTRKALTPGKISYSKIYSSPDENATVIDAGVILAFQNPNSYTGEDVVEFQCHGGYVTPKRVVEACISSGARLARRGEFTERAFLNARLTLDQAQAVLDLIDARTTRAADAASETLNSSSARQAKINLQNLYNEVLEISSTVEHALDISEDELGEDFFLQIRNNLESFKTNLKASIRELREKRILREGALVVLSGPPNVGKSSLMNALLHENRSIVSDIPGTTRDSIEEWLDIDGWPVRLADTAGLRETDDEIEAEGVRRTENLVSKADILVRLTTDQCDVEKKDNEIIVLSKADLLSVIPTGNFIAISTKTNYGLSEFRDELIRKLEHLADSGSESNENSALYDLGVLLEAKSLLENILSLPIYDLVLIGNQLRQICEKFGSVIGAEYSSDLLTQIFSRFCVGK